MTVRSINSISVEALDLASVPNKKHEPVSTKTDPLVDALDLAGKADGSLSGRTVSRREMKEGRSSIQNIFDCIFSSNLIKDFTFSIKLFDSGGRFIYAITNVFKPLSYHSIERESPSSNSLLWLIAKSVSLLSFPFVIFNLGKQLKNCITAYRQGNRGLGFIAGLNVVIEVSNLTWIVGTLLKGLDYLKIPLKKSALVASRALLQVSVVLSLASFLLKIKHWYDHKKLGHAVKDLSEAIKQDGKTLQKLYGVENGADLKRRLTAIWEKAQLYQGAKREEFLNPINKALKERVKSQNFSYRLTILTHAISLIATPILMFGGPLTPVGFALVGVSALIDIVKTVKNWRQDRHFERLIEEHTPKVEYLLKLPFNDASRKYMRKIPWNAFKEKIRTKALIDWKPTVTATL